VHGLSAEVLRRAGATGKPVAEGVSPAVEGARLAARKVVRLSDDTLSTHAAFRRSGRLTLRHRQELHRIGDHDFALGAFV